jgi:outer membrane protein
MTGQVDVLHEITGHNHGNEVRAALGIPLSRVGGVWTADVGITWKSAAIVNYYYGAPHVYEAGAALDPFVKLAYSRPLKGKWKITAFVECEHLGNAIADSPIVNARFVTTTFVGTVYAF